MSDERLERLTKLARKAWPYRPRARTVHCFDGVWSVVEDPFDGLDDEHQLLLESADVERFEAALRVLAGEPVGLSDLDRGCFESMKHNAKRMREQCARENVRADSAEARLAAVQEKIGEWRSNAQELERKEGGGVRGAIEDMANELLDAMKATT